MTASGPTYPAALSLDGRRAGVTGGTKGAGAAVVRRLRHAGAYVIAVARSLPGEPIDADEFVAADISTPEGPMPWPLMCGAWWCADPRPCRGRLEFTRRRIRQPDR